MKIISETTDFCLEEKTAVAIGKFDGIHLGHRCLLNEILEQKNKGLKACVFTFSPAPAVFLGYSDGKELSTTKEKRRIFEAMGVDVLVEYPMNETTAKMPAETFLSEVFVKQLNAGFIAAGYDVSFGAKGAGNLQLLEEMSIEHGYEIKIIDKVCIEGKVVSSTSIREEVEKGNMEQVKTLLGTPYLIMGQVVCGNQIGRTLGFPTVNLIPEAEKLLPPKGVYCSGVEVDNKHFYGISNIGYKPTIEENEKVLNVETYIYDFDENVYGKEIEVFLYDFVREEKKFNSLAELKKQIELDKEIGRKYMENR